MTADNKKTQIAIDPNPIKKIDMIDKDGFKITGSSRAEVMKKWKERRINGEIN